MGRYVELSGVIRKIFESFTPIVEPLSLDEAFLDLTGTERIHGSPLEAARELKRRVREGTGLVVSVGIAPVKMVAKILSDMSKPDGLLVLGPDHLAEFLNAAAGRAAVERGPRDARAAQPRTGRGGRAVRGEGGNPRDGARRGRRAKHANQVAALHGDGTLCSRCLG